MPRHGYAGSTSDAKFRDVAPVKGRQLRRLLRSVVHGKSYSSLSERYSGCLERRAKIPQSAGLGAYFTAFQLQYCVNGNLGLFPQIAKGPAEKDSGLETLFRRQSLIV
jgi:hypothetical protein